MKKHLKFRLGVLAASVIVAAFLGGVAVGHDRGFVAGNESGYDLGLSVGVDRGWNAGVTEMRKETSGTGAVVAIRQDEWLNRSIGIALPEPGVSYVCEVTRESEVQTGLFTFMYDEGTRCYWVQEDISELWNDPDFEDVLVGNNITVS